MKAAEDAATPSDEGDEKVRVDGLLLVTWWWRPVTACYMLTFRALGVCARICMVTEGRCRC